jgi:hypothetical protein
MITKNHNTLARITEIFSALLILLFVYTALSKLIDLSRFSAVLKSSPLIGTTADWIAHAIPGAELLTAAFLIFPATRRWGFVFSSALMLLFTGYVAWMLATASKLPCSCGGVIQHMGWKSHLIFNSAFTILALLGLHLDTKLFIAINRESRKPVNRVGNNSKQKNIR